MAKYSKKGTKVKATPVPLKDDKSTKNNNGKYSKKKKKAFVIREEHPGLVLPFAILVLILVVLGIGNKYFFDDVGRVLPLFIGGISIIIFLSLAPFFHNKNYLYPSAIKKLTIISVPLLIVCCGGIFLFATWSISPVHQGSVNLSEPENVFQLNSSGLYGLFVKGSFKGEEREPEEDASKIIRKTGSYKMSITSKDGQDEGKIIVGKFKQSSKKRKLAKRGRGYVVNRNTSNFDGFWGKPGPYNIELTGVSGDINDQLEVDVYKKGVIVYLLMLLGLIPIFFGNFIDSIIRSSRILSMIGPGTGACWGFVTLFYFESSPIIKFPTMVMDVFIGGFAGAMIAYGLLAITKKWYQNIILKKGISL